MGDMQTALQPAPDLPLLLIAGSAKAAWLEVHGAGEDLTHVKMLNT